MSNGNTEGLLIAAAFLTKPSQVHSGLQETAQEALATTAWAPEPLCAAVGPIRDAADCGWLEFWCGSKMQLPVFKCRAAF